MDYYFLVGSTAAGKSTTERNLRLRLAGVIKTGDHQVVPEQGLIFAGRLLTKNGKKMLRFSGGDATRWTWDKLIEAKKFGNEICPAEYDKVLYEKYNVTDWVVEELVKAGHSITVFHIDIPRPIAVKRLQSLDHPAATDPKHPYYRPGDQDYQARRDKLWSSMGVDIHYVCADLRERCQIIEGAMGVVPLHDHVVYDFQGPIVDVRDKFLAGGDPCPRPLDETVKERKSG